MGPRKIENIRGKTKTKALQMNSQPQQSVISSGKKLKHDSTKQITVKSATGKVIGVITADGKFLMPPMFTFKTLLRHLIGSVHI